jgi:hypothetical protein
MGKKKDRGCRGKCPGINGDEYELSIQRNHVSKWTYRVEILGGKMEVLI